jgi:hypothetical protein
MQKFIQLKEVILPFCSVFILVVLSLSSASCAAQHINPDKPHHTENGFRNPDLKDDHGFFDFLRWRWQRLWKDIPGADAYDFPMAKNDPEFLRANNTKKRLRGLDMPLCFFRLTG